MSKHPRKLPILIFGLISLLQAGLSVAALANIKKHRKFSSAMAIVLLVVNAAVGLFFVLRFIAENLPKRKFAADVTYENSDDVIFDFDIDALSDDELEAMLK